jgi:hypothetical protein
LQEAMSFFGGHALQHSSIGRDRLEQIDGVAKTRGVFR